MSNNRSSNDNADGSVNAATTQDMEETMSTHSHQPEMPETESLAGRLALYLDQHLDGGLDASLIPLLNEIDEVETAYRKWKARRDKVKAHLEATREAREAEIITPEPAYEVIGIPLTLGSEPECPVCWFSNQDEAEQRARELMEAYVKARIFVVRQLDTFTVTSPYGGLDFETRMQGWG